MTSHYAMKIAIANLSEGLGLPLPLMEDSNSKAQDKIVAIVRTLSIAHRHEYGLLKRIFGHDCITCLCANHAMNTCQLLDRSPLEINKNMRRGDCPWVELRATMKGIQL